MANQDSKAFPMLPVGHWWTLREKFNQSIPGVVTDNYLATALNIQPSSARNNILPYLKDMGLIDTEGKTQDLVKAWRDDGQYEEVCKKILAKIYPEDLITAVHRPSEDRAAVERWFANHSGAGDGAVKRMAAIYVVIAEADISKRPQKKGRAKKASSATPKSTPKVAKARTPLPSPQAPPAPIPQTSGQGSTLTVPGVSINLEIHISSDATPDQIDKIFESIAKHLYKK